MKGKMAEVAVDGTVIMHVDQNNYKKKNRMELRKRGIKSKDNKN